MGDTYNAQRTPLHQGVFMKYIVEAKQKLLEGGGGGMKWHVTSIPSAKIIIL